MAHTGEGGLFARVLGGAILREVGACVALVAKSEQAPCPCDQPEDVLQRLEFV